MANINIGTLDPLYYNLPSTTGDGVTTGDFTPVYGPDYSQTPVYGANKPAATNNTGILYAGAGLLAIFLLMKGGK